MAAEFRELILRVDDSLQPPFDGQLFTEIASAAQRHRARTTRQDSDRVASLYSEVAGNR